MALFAESDDWIKERLRLSSVPASSTDTLAIIADAIADARLSFYRRLGRLRVAAILETAEVAEPDTNDEVLRSLASRTEVRLVRIRLLQELPTGFMDASGDVFKRWNNEAPVREYPRSDREREISRLTEDVEQAMQMLAGSESVGDEVTIFIHDGTPAEVPPLPGDSLYPYTRRYAND